MNRYLWSGLKWGYVKNVGTSRTVMLMSVTVLMAIALPAPAIAEPAPAAKSGNYVTTVGKSAWSQDEQAALTEQHAVPMAEVTQPAWRVLSAGAEHTCAVSHSGLAFCWGLNEYGQLGNGSTQSSTVPTPVVGLESRVVQIAAGSDHTCAVMDSGGVKCWGGNWLGSLGDGTWKNSTIPVDVVGLSGSAETVSAGVGHSCAVLRRSRAVQCWGANYTYGMLGNGSTQSSNTPVSVVGLPGPVQDVSAGWFQTCAVTVAGGLWCWGRNDSGQVGDGTRQTRLSPVSVLGLSSDVTQVTRPNGHVCALTSSGKVRCWGDNESGEHGTGGYVSTLKPQTTVKLPARATNVVAGPTFSCALAGQRTFCWGSNYYGELGIGKALAMPRPAELKGLRGVARLSAGSWTHACALTTGGTLSCWGDNSHGQLGDGSTASRRTPVQVAAP